MSIKATLAYGRSFHFYHEALDNNHVYLELEDVPYEVGYRRLMVAIPIDIWEVIRGLGAAKLDLITVTDDEIINMVGTNVDQRMAEFERARRTASEEAERLRFIDSLQFGAADASREEQIMRGFEYYKTERARQREILSRIRQHKIIDIGGQAIED